MRSLLCLSLALSACGPAMTGDDAGPPDAGPPPRPTAFIQATKKVFARDPMGVPLLGFELKPWFFDPSVGCIESTVASCRMFECTPRGTTPPAHPLNAGDITYTDVTNGALYHSRVTPAGNYPESEVYSDWTVGDELHFDAPGMTDGAPAFSQTLTAPLIIDVTAPVFSTTTGLTISRTVPLEVAWANAAHAVVTVELRATAATGVTYMFCDYPGEAGSANVPVEALQHLGATDIGEIAIGVESLSVTQSGDWTYVVWAMSTGDFGPGSAIAGVTFE